MNANEHLRRTVHEQQLKAEQQLQQLKQEVQAREQQIVKGFEEPLASARQKTADALVCHFLATNNKLVCECIASNICS